MPKVEPKLDEAWKHFRTRVNPRRVKMHQEGSTRKFRLANEKELEISEPVPLFGSAISDYPEFGLGIGLYYKQVLGLMWLCLIYGAVLIPTAQYLGSPAYSDHTMTDPKTGGDTAVTGLLKFSAACHDYNTVDVLEGAEKCGEAGCTHASACTLLKRMGIFDFAALIMLIIFCIVTARVQEKQVEELDEAVQTPQDYSLVVNDPDEDADDPDEWNQFFSQFGEVAYVTVTRKNGPLLKALSQRKVIVHEIQANGWDEEEEKLRSPDEAHTLLDHPAPSFWEKLKGGKEAWMYKLVKINEQIAKLSHPDKEYPVCKVYVIFQTEEGQRNALEALTTGAIPAAFEISTVEDKYKFRGTNVLSVEEAVEPSEVLWENLELSVWYSLAQSLVSLVLTALLIYWAYLAIYAAKKSAKSTATGLVVSVINVLLPIVLRMITMVEKHVDQGNKQDSLFLKTTAARFMNTAIINFMITDFHDTLDAAAIKTIMSILISDAIITPTVGLIDISGNLKRLFLSKFAKTHAKLEKNFQGTPWNLGERYTGMSKTLFVAMFYAALFPPGLWVAALCFAYTYWADKYLLLRVWQKPPQYDAQLAIQARGHIMFSLLVHLLITAHWYYGWPFDNTYLSSDGVYKYQDKNSYNLVKSGKFWFAFYVDPKSTWQNAEQQFLVKIYGIASLALLGFLLVFYLYKDIVDTVNWAWYGDYDAVGESQGIPYNAVESITTYVPMSVFPSDPTVGPLPAAYCENLMEHHYPDLCGKEFNEQNVARDFSVGDQKRLFGKVKGYDVGFKGKAIN
uniref:CSC1/OSCA1-like cytosolic domain-containing protein n=1 Tax=Fibrocapsa japonica TaxID=94617 RepID=A0A7S2V6J7_9STRA|mmetsp:Transcript_6837/g.10318  ORF Transcript_6837/g.10318 Transcript_6837/m.10318 type:complete len:791 (+) Transcript_6837:82-2454(+)|eukprot:CAMPEP_0113934242 /NCGR_PEP_ID=MMETSP1339-20121228/1584_1 /TAXON_ID=94617 /ORGANISM="Fibrocapsa japonica" /LENGTH=790 /DNA_ID=CAMNT_0000935959 /DNA_START=15 /DNA_END=2387 /DNA_ORIENTATION=- /assembly_acc=CAM_ASM_000762